MRYSSFRKAVWSPARHFWCCRLPMGWLPPGRASPETAQLSVPKKKKPKEKTATQDWTECGRAEGTGSRDETAPARPAAP